MFTADAEKPAADPPAESAAPEKPPDSEEVKPNGDSVKWKAPAHIELTVEDKTDDEGVNSNKTSVESLREANNSNSNNNGRPLEQPGQ